MRRSRIILAVIGVLSFVGCSDEVEHIWDEESRINEYTNWIDGTICRNVVDNLDFMFQTSAYRDSLRNGGDVNAVIERQFSNPHLRPPMVNELGEICWFASNAEHYIQHNGVSLDEDGALWRAYGRMGRFWDGVYQQPLVEYCEWFVSRENGVYTLSGGMIHNGLWDKFFTMSNFVNLKFTTSIAEVDIWTYGENPVHKKKQTLRYCFNGDIYAVAAGKVDHDMLPRPDVYMILDDITGHNAKEYIGGIPVFGAPYFDEGRTTATLSNGTNSWRIVVDYTQGVVDYMKL